MKLDDHPDWLRPKQVWPDPTDQPWTWRSTVMLTIIVAFTLIGLGLTALSLWRWIASWL